jgi:hypothetical protein
MLKTIISTTAFLLLFVSIATAQTGKQEPTNNNSGKKNVRPTDANAEPEKTVVKTAKSEHKPAHYSYEFSQPQFFVSHVSIEHDSEGKGTITLGHKDYDEEYTDSIQLSEKTLEKLDALWTALNFLESDENYQSEARDYGHLGNMIFKMEAGKHERTAKFNWSENADAQALAREYKKITNQFVWMFDITVSRENQPLESPRIMKSLDSMLKRDDIADPNQMIPFLKKLSEDERVPLITRNHALRLVKEIEKKKK